MPNPRDEGLRPPAEPRFAGEAQPRAVGAPLPVGSTNLRPGLSAEALRFEVVAVNERLPAAASQAKPVLTQPPSDNQVAAPSGPDQAHRGQSGREEPNRDTGIRALPSPRATAPADGPSGLQRAVGAFRAALPFVQKLLPLLEGNVASAVSNMLAPQHHAPPVPVQPPVNLAPLQDGLAQLQTLHRELHGQVAEQVTSLKRVEDQLDAVREATDRNTLEQQELLQDLKGVGRKMNLFAIAALGLLAVSVIVNVVLYLHIIKVLP